LPNFFEVHVAYDVRRGNPLKKYNPADFDLGSVSISSSGIEVKKLQGNRMIAAIRDPQFTVTVSGFDEHRDLFIRVSSKEEFNDSED
jgi:hypothetical protein